jgi:hypothetical protein
MRLNRISFVVGLAAGYVAGARAGRERYDQIVKLAKQAKEHPAVQQATSTAADQASSLLNTAGQKAPKVASNAMQKASDHIPMLKHRDGHGSSGGNGGSGNGGGTGKERPVSATGSNSHQGQSKSLRVSRRGAARHGS